MVGVKLYDSFVEKGRTIHVLRRGGIFRYKTATMGQAYKAYSNSNNIQMKPM